MSCRRRRARLLTIASFAGRRALARRRRSQRADVRFTRREVARADRPQQHPAWGASDAAGRSSNIVIAHRGGRGTSFVYELLYDGRRTTTGRRLPGLIDVELLRGDTATTSEFTGGEGPVYGVIPAPKRGHSGGMPGHRKMTEMHRRYNHFWRIRAAIGAKTHILEGKKAPTSYTETSSYIERFARAFFFSCFFLSGCLSGWRMNAMPRKVSRRRAWAWPALPQAGAGEGRGLRQDPRSARIAAADALRWTNTSSGC